MPEVMLDMIALVLQGVEGFIFDFPSSPAAFNQSCHIVFINDNVGDPTVFISDFALWCYDLILEKIDSIGILCSV